MTEIEKASVVLESPAESKQDSAAQAQMLEKTLKGKKSGGSLLGAILLYAFFFFVPLIALSLYFYYGSSKDTATIYGTAKEKERYFRMYGNTFNLVFVGDSRTYCGIHPDIMDRHLGTNSINMAVFAHWFPTQYPYYQDMMKRIKPGATVVWTIGHQNFVNSGTIQTQYPLKVKNLPSFLSWGYPIESLANNIIHFNPFTQVVDLRSQMHTNLYSFLDTPVAKLSPGDQSSSTAASIAQKKTADSEKSAKSIATADLKKRESELCAYFLKDPNVCSVEFPEEEGQIKSAVLHRSQGSYYRVILEPDFFRRKQAENHAKYNGKTIQYQEFKAATPYWNNFMAILKLFKDNHIKLVVNEIQEAPNTYADERQHDLYVQFMKSKVEPEVRKMGFEYIRVDYKDFTDDDYFDYNHFNSKGGEKYDKMLADKLRPILGSK